MYVIGTAGHVDHGKSTLVQALTGIDTDRLREEKERGLTIDLGFAWLTLPSGREVSIVDVPGHERFIKNMLAGVGAIDLAMLLVAANESVMPQTREHLAILDLLRVKRGLVVISKKDLVDQEMLELVMAEVEDVLMGTTLEGAPMVPVSAFTGEGLPELQETLDLLLETTEARRDSGKPRLSIDRSFTMSGFGTVVTGTLIDGALSAGQEVEILPSGKASRVRGLQSHRTKVDRAMPGRRLAINLSGLSPDELQRGDVLTVPGWLRPTIAMDVRLRLLADAPRPLRHNNPVTLHTGAAETVARVRLLDQDEVRPGEETWAQVRLQDPLAVVKGDYFVIRSSDMTMGGGTVVEPYAKRHRRHHLPTRERLEILEQGSEEDVLLQTLQTLEPCDLRTLSNRANLSTDDVRAKLETLASETLVVILGDQGLGGQRSVLYSNSGWSALTDKTRIALESYHKEHPLRSGIQKEELRSRLNLPAQVFPLALLRLAGAGQVTEEGNVVRSPNHQIELNDGQKRRIDAYVAGLRSNPYSPSTDVSLDEDLLALLVDQGRVVRVNESVIFDAGAYQEMLDRIVATAKERGKINVAEVRDMFGTSRKYAVSLLEFLDQRRITRRVGDDRVLR